MTYLAESERALLGAVMREAGGDYARELLGEAAEIVTPDDFEREAHRHIWRALLAMDEAGRPLDLVTLRAELVRAGALDLAGGIAYVSGLGDGVPRCGLDAVRHWARVISDSGRLRQGLEMARRVIAQAESVGSTADELFSALEQIGAGVALPGAAVLDRKQVARETWALVEAEINGQARGIATGLPDLDERLRGGGWRPGQLVYVGARTSRGKSALLLGFAEAAASRGHSVLFVPLEMTPQELGTRRLVSHSGVSLHGLSRWGKQERDKAIDSLSRACKILSRPLDFASSKTRTLGQIRAAARRLRQRHGLDLLCVDYLGLVGLDRSSKSSLYERTTFVSQGLKLLAMELEIPVLCAVQLNREPSSQGKSSRPSLAHFRDSGAIEQDCDIALLIHQDGTSDAITDGDCELLVAKQRNGWTGAVPAVWRAACARFESRAWAPEDWRGEQR